jgi:hypothetical protein
MRCHALSQCPRASSRNQWWYWDREKATKGEICDGDNEEKHKRSGNLLDFNEVRLALGFLCLLNGLVQSIEVVVTVGNGLTMPSITFVSIEFKWNNWVNLQSRVRVRFFFFCFYLFTTSSVNDSSVLPSMVILLSS